jgi:hypothetical protein
MSYEEEDPCHMRRRIHGLVISMSISIRIYMVLVLVILLPVLV